MHENQHTWDEYDAQGIFLTRVCDKCVDAKLSQYRSEILSGYSQANVDEPIEPDDEFPSDRYILAESNSRNNQF
jgi:hypothetical protein